METQNLTVDEAMQDILDALVQVSVPEVPEGYKSVNEIWAASGKSISRKQMANNLNIAAERGFMDKKLFGKYAYYKAVKR